MKKRILIFLVAALIILGTILILILHYRAVTVQALVQDWRGEDYDLAQLATEKIIKMGPIAVQPLVQFLKDRNSEIRWRAVSTLGNLRDKRVIEPLIETLKYDESPEVRTAAAIALRKIGSEEKRPPEKLIKSLIEALKDKDKEVKRAAISALGILDTEQALKPLLSALRDKEVDIREAAAEALGALGSPGAKKPLLKALKDKDENVRRAAAQSLGEIGLRTAPKGLVEAVKDNSSQVRISAVIALGKIRDKRLVPVLKKATKDKHYWVRRAARKVLKDWKA